MRVTTAIRGGGIMGYCIRNLTQVAVDLQLRRIVRLFADTLILL